MDVHGFSDFNYIHFLIFMDFHGCSWFFTDFHGCSRVFLMDRSIHFNACARVSAPDQVATQPVLLSHLARRLVDEAHAKSEAGSEVFVDKFSYNRW